MKFDVFASGSSQSESPKWTAETHRATLDIDGFGTPVVFVPSSNVTVARPADVRFTMYLMRGDCGVDIGRVQGLVEPTPLVAATNGLHDLENEFPTGAEHPRYAINLLRFDGQRYVAVGSARPRF